jgi:DNA-binding transcriptional LysR family regulator
MLRRVNLNLFRVLRVLLRERNVSRAAEVLGLTQSGASTALRRLREALDDPLLVQVGQEMVLTDRAQALIYPLEQVMGALEKMLDPIKCTPATLDRRFKIWTVDFIVLRMAALLVPKLSATAPGVSIRFVDLSTDALDISLGRGDADLAMVPVTVKPTDSIIIDSEFLFRDQFVAVVGPNHPVATKRKVTAEQMALYRCVAFHSGIDSWSLEQQRKFAGYGGNVSPVIQLQQFSVLPLLAASTDTIAIAPRSAATLMQKFTRLQILELPGEPVEFEIHLMWSSVHTHDPVHRWFRDLIIAVSRSP